MSKKNWKHVLTQKVVTLNTCLPDIPVATHHNRFFSVFKMVAVRRLEFLKFNFLRVGAIKRPFCITVPNYVKISQTVVEIPHQPLPDSPTCHCRLESFLPNTRERICFHSCRRLGSTFHSQRTTGRSLTCRPCPKSSRDSCWHACGPTCSALSTSASSSLHTGPAALVARGQHANLIKWSVVIG